MTWVGPDTVSGQSVNHVTILPPATASAGEPQQLAQCELYVNPQTGVPVRIRVYQHPIDRRASVPLDLDFTDYQAVSGLLFPMAISFSIAGQPMSESICNRSPLMLRFPRAILPGAGNENTIEPDSICAVPDPRCIVFTACQRSIDWVSHKQQFNRRSSRKHISIRSD